MFQLIRLSMCDFQIKICMFLLRLDLCAQYPTEPLKCLVGITWRKQIFCHPFVNMLVVAIF